VRLLLALGLGVIGAIVSIAAEAASSRSTAAFTARPAASGPVAALAVGWVPLVFFPVLPR
jgi:hypothetical protein